MNNTDYQDADVISKYFKSFFSFKGWVILLSFAFLGFSIYENIDKFTNLTLTYDSYLLIFYSLIINIISVFLNAFAWKEMLRWLAFKKNKPDIIYLFVTSNIYKYIPGGIWHFVERIRYLSKSYEVDKSFLAVFLEPLLMITAAVLFFPFAGWQSGLSIFSFIPLLLFTPKFINKSFKLIKRFKEKQFIRIAETLDIEIKLNKLIVYTVNYPYKALFIEILFILSRFLAFVFCLNSFNSTPEFGICISAFSLAWTIGLIVPGAPGGIGIFESIMFLRLQDYMLNEKLIAVLLCYRLTATIADFLSSILIRIIRSPRIKRIIIR